MPGTVHGVYIYYLIGKDIAMLYLWYASNYTGSEYINQRL